MTLVNMGFMVAGAVLMGAPLILHLLRRRRKRTVELSTFRFLFANDRADRRSLRLLEYLVLALRMLAVLAMGMLFAKPSLESRPWAWMGVRAGRSRVLILDTSASMSARERGVSRLALAKRLAAEFVAQADPSDAFSLIESHREARLILREVRHDRDRVTAALDALEPTPHGNRIGLALEAAAAILEGASAGRKEVFIFSDLQAYAWEPFLTPGQSPLDGFDPETVLSLVRIGDAGTPNVALLPDGRADPPASVRIPVDIRAAVVNFSDEPRDILVTGRLTPAPPGKDEVRFRQSRILPPGARWALSAPHPFEDAGVHTFTFEITGDALPLDDRLPVAIPVRPPVKALIVDGGQPPSGVPDGFYVAHALQPGLEAGDRDAGVQVIRTTPNRFNLNQLEDLDLEVLVWVNTPTLLMENPTVRDGVLRFVEAGGGLLLLPGDASVPDAYNTLPSLGRAHHPLMPARLSRPVRFEATGTGAGYVRLGAVDDSHPVFSAFDGASAAALTLPRFYRIWALDAPDAGKGRTLAAFTDNRPAMVECAYGRGRVILCAFLPIPDWTSLPLQPVFVPLLQRLVATLRPPPPVQGPTAVPVDAETVMTVPAGAAHGAIRLIAPGGDIRRLTPQTRGGTTVLAIPALDRIGRYRLEPDPPVPEDIAGEFIAHIPEAESDLRRALTRSELDALEAAPSRISLVEAGDDLSLAAASLASGRQLWRILAWLVIGLMMTEMLLAHRAHLPRSLIPFSRGNAFPGTRTRTPKGGASPT